MNSLRIQLAEARAHLRRCEDNLKLTKVEAEQRIIDAAGGPKSLGSNEAERDRRLYLELTNDPLYTFRLDELRNAQAHVDRLEAELNDVIDQRRGLDRESRDHLATALLALASAGKFGILEEAL